MDGTLKQEASHAVDTAILLTSVGLFDHGDAGNGEPVPSPLTRVGGMTLFQRAVFTLQRGGISQIWVLVGPEEQALRRLLREDSRIQAAVRWLPVREFPPQDPLTWETLAEEINGACMIVGCHTVYSPSLVQRLRNEGSQGKAVVVIGQPDEGHHGGNPGVLFRPEGLEGRATSTVVFHDNSMRQSSPSTVASPSKDQIRLPLVGDLMVLPARLLGISGVLQAHGANPLRLALEQAAIEGAIRTMGGSSHVFRDVRGPKGPQLAERTLLQSLQTLKGGFDGWMDRYVNRKLSGYLTRGFLRLGWSPNTITLVSMSVGLVAAILFVPGFWALAVLGALVFQLSAIIDCCDGEVARLTFSESKFGQELDIWADNVVHIVLFAGIACGAFLNGPWEQTQLPLLLGASVVMANVVSLLLVNHARHLRARPRGLWRLTERERGQLDFLLGKIVNRDFSILVLLCAALGFLHWFLVLAAIASWVFVMSMAWTLRRSLIPRA
jgi:1L-myo-inositol 1-phosphate cytidylyltransferase / CDP-L-myo-inositol myo-inositolphosphotransferase